MFTTTLLTQDTAYSAGRDDGAPLLPLLGLFLLAAGVYLRERQHNAGPQHSSRGPAWLIGIGAFLLFGGVAGVAGAT